MSYDGYLQWWFVVGWRYWVSYRRGTRHRFAAVMVVHVRGRLYSALRCGDSLVRFWFLFPTSEFIYSGGLVARLNPCTSALWKVREQLILGPAKTIPVLWGNISPGSSIDTCCLGANQDIVITSVKSKTPLTLLKRKQTRKDNYIQFLTPPRKLRTWACFPHQCSYDT